MLLKIALREGTEWLRSQRKLCGVLGVMPGLSPWREGGGTAGMQARGRESVARRDLNTAMEIAGGTVKLHGTGYCREWGLRAGWWYQGHPCEQVSGIGPAREGFYDRCRKNEPMRVINRLQEKKQDCLEMISRASMGCWLVPVLVNLRFGLSCYQLQY